MKTETAKIEEVGCAPVPSEVRKKHSAGGCYGSTEVAIVVPRRSWRKFFLEVHRKSSPP